MMISNIRIKLENINEKGIPTDSAKAVAVNSKASDKESGTSDKYNIVCLGAKGSQYSIKIPFTPENEKKIATLQKILDKDETALIIPDADSIKIRAYAFIGNKGNLISGVSVNADTFTISNDNDEEIII